MKITNNNKIVFMADYSCEHCGYTIIDIWHTGNYFNNKVVPQMICHKCHNNSAGVDCLNNPIK